MSLTSRDTGGAEIEPVTPGIHMAVSIGLFDLGTQTNTFFQTTYKRVVLMFEVPGEQVTFTDRNGQEVTKSKLITREYTNSLSNKAHLRHHLESWRNKRFTPEELDGFSLLAVLKASAQIQVMHETTKRNTIYPVINMIMPYPQGTAKLVPTLPVIAFDVESDSEIPAETPNWIRDKIIVSPEWRERHGQAPPPGAAPPPATQPGEYDHQQPPPYNPEDDIPF